MFDMSAMSDTRSYPPPPQPQCPKQTSTHGAEAVEQRWVGEGGSSYKSLHEQSTRFDWDSSELRTVCFRPGLFSLRCAPDAVAGVLSPRHSVSVSAWVRADGLLLLLCGAGAAAGLAAGGHAHHGGLLLGRRMPATLSAVWGTAVCACAWPPGLRTIPARQVLNECAQSATLQLLLLLQQWSSAPERGCALWPRVDPGHDGGGSKRRAEWAARIPGQLRRLLTHGWCREDGGAAGGGAVTSGLFTAAAGSRRCTWWAGCCTADTRLLWRVAATPCTALPRLPAAICAQTDSDALPTGWAAALAKPVGKWNL